MDDISETIDPVIAEESVKTEFLEVAPGQVAGVHQVARGFIGGEEKIFLELKMYVGAKHPADTIELRGLPGLTCTIPGVTRTATRLQPPSPSTPFPQSSPRSRGPAHRPRPAPRLLPARPSRVVSVEGNFAAHTTTIS